MRDRLGLLPPLSLVGEARGSPLSLACSETSTGVAPQPELAVPSTLLYALLALLLGLLRIMRLEAVCELVAVREHLLEAPLSV